MTNLTIDVIKNLMSITMSQSQLYSTLDLMGDLSIIEVVSPPINYKYTHKKDQNKVFVFIGDASKYFPNETDCIYAITCGKGENLYNLIESKHSWKTNIKECHTLVILKGRCK